MKYLVVQSGLAGDEQSMCDDETQTINLIESKLRDGASETELKIYALEQVTFQVERVPVVTLAEEGAAEKSVESADPGPVFNDLSNLEGESKSEDLNPFTSEQVFSLDS